MLKEALSYPLEADHKLKTIGIGGLLYIAPYLVIIPAFLFRNNTIVYMYIINFFIFLAPLILLAGYSFRELPLAAQRKETVPRFTNWTGLFVDGLKIVMITIVYMLIPVILIFGASAYLSGSGGYYFGFLLALSAWFLLPAAVTNFALLGRFGAIFELRTLATAAVNRWYVLTVVFWTILSFFSMFLYSGPIRVIIGCLILFYGQLVMTYLLGASCGSHLIEDSEKAIAD